MIKKQYKTYIASLLILAATAFTVSSCKKSFLEILPKGRVIATKTTDYDLLLNNLDLINSSSNNQVLMGDEVAAFEPQWNLVTYKDKQVFKWEGDLYNADEDANETLSPVKALYIYNKVINEVLNSTEGTDAAKKSLQAEALTGRAWTNFLLVNYYGKPYQASSAASDLGFPLILEADINGQSYTRATVQQAYDQIIQDLTTAIPNLSHEGVQHRIRVSKITAQAILAKVYVFMGRYEEAKPLLIESIDNLNKSLITTALLDYNTANLASLPTIVNDTENVYAKNMTNIHISLNQKLLWLTEEAAALFQPNDARFQKLFISQVIDGKTWYKRTGTTTNNIGVRVPELYLLLAETKAHLGDFSGAREDLLYLRKHRMPAAEAPVPTSVADDKLQLLQFIMEERTREFAMCGYRWFDMRRTSVDPIYPAVQYTHRVYGADGVQKESYQLRPERMVFKFSPKVRSENPTIQDNP